MIFKSNKPGYCSLSFYGTLSSYNKTLVTSILKEVINCDVKIIDTSNTTRILVEYPPRIPISDVKEVLLALANNL